VVEKDTLIASKAWVEVCHSISGPSVFCVDPSLTDNRNGPFMLFNQTNLSNTNDLRPLYRCYNKNTSTHLISAQADCEGKGSQEMILGYLSSRPGGDTLRALYRCEVTVELKQHNSSTRDKSSRPMYTAEGETHAQDSQSGFSGYATVYSHALDLPCDSSSTGTIMGYVR